MTTVPVPYRVTAVSAETADCVSLEVAPVGRALPEFSPGRFAMVYAFGVGEVPISVSATGDGRRLVHTVRAIGAVTGALCLPGPGTRLACGAPTVRAGTSTRRPGWTSWWSPHGIGLAPLRPVVRHLLDRPGHYGRLHVLIGARTPEDLLYGEELEHWRRASAEVEVTVDRPVPGWRGSVGVVTTLLDRVDWRPDRTAALICGPEVMIRHTARVLLTRGLPARRIQVSLERNMRCGTGHCGHCQLGPLLLCRDGPVVGYDRARPLLAVREL